MAKKSKTIVLVINSLGGRGGERSVLTLAEGFHRLGCHVHIIYFSDKVDYLLNNNFAYHFINSWAYRFIFPRDLRYRLFAKKVDSYILERIGVPDLILSNLNQPNLIMSHSHLQNIAHVIRNTFSQERLAESRRKRILRNKLFAEALVKHPCICISKGVADDLESYLQPYLKYGESISAHVIYNAFDKVQIEQMGNKFVPKDKNYLLHVGAFSYAKDHQTLLKAYARSKKTYPLFLLGKGKSEEALKQLAKTLNVSDNVKFLGFHSNPYPFIKHAKALLLSSRYEGFGRVIMEAVALHTPVISTDCPSGPSELLPKVNLSPVGNIEALATQIDRAMQKPEQFRVPFDEKFLPENIAQQYLDFFNIK